MNGKLGFQTLSLKADPHLTSITPIVSPLHQRGRTRPKIKIYLTRSERYSRLSSPGSRAYQRKKEEMAGGGKKQRRTEPEPEWAHLPEHI
ncbi:hypothetical protein F2Q68_00029224 [Brassica cretica]|uniref:Uncharacterized protein n=1 Tax=Brassica cretica TaxID=69181 RepID=A0A8S9G900_BRACR|nr:hypothetical protein F2Q68_00029224 [Brassica cretica]